MSAFPDCCIISCLAPMGDEGILKAFNHGITIVGIIPQGVSSLSDNRLHGKHVTYGWGFKMHMEFN